MKKASCGPEMVLPIWLIVVPHLLVLAPPSLDHPLQIIDHMSCHTVVFRVDKPKTVTTGGGFRAENTATSVY